MSREDAADLINDGMRGLRLAEGDFRAVSPRFRGDALAANMRLFAAIAERAAAKGCVPTQLALAWVLHQGPDIVPIPATAKIAQLEENPAAADIRLSPADLAVIEAAAPPAAVQGDRYDAAGAALVEG